MKSIYFISLISNRIIKGVLFFLVLSYCSCATTHHKDQLIDHKTIDLTATSLQLNGYYYTELERDANASDSIEGKIKYLSVFFIYEDGFVVFLGGIDGVTNYFCADNPVIENSYENAHKNVGLMLTTQFSNDARLKRICGFKPNDIANKGLAEIVDDQIKIQFYAVEKQHVNRDSFNSYYLYELNGRLLSNTSFTISSETNYRQDKTTEVEATYKFMPILTKPKVPNYFKEHNF